VPALGDRAEVDAVRAEPFRVWVRRCTCGPAPSLKDISAPPLGISRDFDDHVRTSACSASPFRCGMTPKRDQLANTVATKKTDKNADQRTRCEFHDNLAPCQTTILPSLMIGQRAIRNRGGREADDGQAELAKLGRIASPRRGTVRPKPLQSFRCSAAGREPGIHNHSARKYGFQARLRFATAPR
jgi:hypothetical protein